MDTKQIFDEIKKALKASAKYDDESSLMVGGDSLELMRKIPDHSPRYYNLPCRDRFAGQPL